MAILEILDESVVKTPMEAVDKDEAIAELIEVLVNAGRIIDREAAIEAIQRREAQGTTGIGGGVGIPHAKHETVDALCMAIGISPEGVEFDALDDELVHLVFLVMAQGNNPGPHVQLLAELAELLEVPDFKDNLLAAGSPQEVIAIVRAAEESEE